MITLTEQSIGKEFILRTGRYVECKSTNKYGEYQFNDGKTRDVHGRIIASFGNSPLDIDRAITDEPKVKA